MSILIFGCKKEGPFQKNVGGPLAVFGKISSPQDYGVKNYIALLFSEHPGYIDSNYKYSLTVFAKFLNNNTTLNSAGVLSVNNFAFISPDANNNYAYNSQVADVNKVKEMYGNRIPISVAGNGSVNSETENLYVPRRIFNYNLDSILPTLANNKPHTLTWTADPQNIFGKVVIQLTYLQSNSIDNNPNNPSKVEALLYTPLDNGSFTIPATDLARFPVSSFVMLSISRATDNFFPIPQPPIDYIAIVSADSSPILILN